MASPIFTFSKFIDLLLVKLYDLDRELGDKFFDLNWIAQQIIGNSPEKWGFDAAKVLESRGLAMCIFTFGGVQGQITGEGRLYVEEDRGKTEEIKKDRPNYYINVTGDNNQVGVQSTQTMTVKSDEGLASKLVREMKAAIESDEALQGADKAEAVSYLDLVEKEAKRPAPNRNILAAVLEPLSKIASIAGNVAKPIQIING